MEVKSNAISLKHKRSPETLFIHRIQFIRNVHVRQPFHSKPFLSTKIVFSKFSFFQNFVSFYFILFYFSKILFHFFSKNFVVNSVHEQPPNSDSEPVLSPKTGWVHQVHSLGQPVHTNALRRARVAVSWHLSGLVTSLGPVISWPGPAVSQECAACANALLWPCLALLRHSGLVLSPLF